MRAGPLSDDSVVKIINAQFVPVYLVIEDYEPKGRASPAEKLEFARVCGDISDAKKGVAFIVHPNGSVIETIISSPAITTEYVLNVLTNAATSIGAKPGPTLGEKVPQAPAPEANPGELVLHLAARYLPKGGNGWARMPAEDWIVLSVEDCQKFIGSAVPAVGVEWNVDGEVSKKLLTYFYPPSLNFYPKNGRLDKHDLKATVVSVKDDVALIRIDGSMKMKRAFTFAKDDNLFVEADIVGYMEYDLKTKQLRKMQLITDKGAYSKAAFGIAVQSLP